MTSGAEGEWVRQGTPRDDNADWNEEQSEYGTALSPAEWDDYSSEQSVPVATPRAQLPEGTPTAASPGTATQPEPEPVPGQEPDSEEEYRSDETGGSTEDDPAGDPDDTGVDPEYIDAPAQQGATAIIPDGDATFAEGSRVEDESMATARPRPIVPDNAAAVEPAESHRDVESLAGEDTSGGTDTVDASDEADESHVDAAEYLAVDPVPADSALDEPGVTDTDSRQGEQDFPVSHEEDDVLDTDVPVTETDDEGNGVPDENQTYDEMEATQAVPVTVVGSDAETTGAVPDGLYRADGAEPTAVIAEDTYPDVDVEEERLQARLDAERQAREQRLGAVATSSENASREDDGAARVTTDKFFPSFSLFVLRLVTASILGLTSWQILGSGVDATANYLAGFPLIPEPRLVAWILGFTLGALALLLVIGLLQRVVGFVLLAVAVAALTFLRWGSSISIFDADTAGFIGDKDLLLAAIGLLLLGMGGGRWGIDGAFRAARAASKAERQD